MTKHLLKAVLIVCALTGAHASAAPIEVTSYDVTNAHLSGYGHWYHTYDGTISSTGKTSSQDNDPLYNYTGGSGTLNDGKIGTSERDTMLFFGTDNFSITLHLGTTAAIDTLELFSFWTTRNAIPGTLSDLNITINSITVNLETLGFGDASWWNGGPHERVSLIGTALEGLVTDTITLSGFKWATGISEIAVYGTEVPVSPVSSVPEPASIALLAMGLIGFNIRRRRSPSPCSSSNLR